MAHEGTFPILYRDHGLPAGAGMATGYLARPDTKGTYPLVVVLGGLDGITSAVRDLCRRLARHGYTVVAPDVHRSTHPGEEADQAAQIAAYHRLSDRQAMHDIADAIEWMTKDDAAFALPGKVAMMGIDLGGRLALIYAAHHQTQVAGVAVAYAPLAGDEEREHTVGDVLDMLPMPVLGLYGADDELVPAEGVDEAQRRNAHGQWLLYQGAGHGFLDEDADTYDAAASGDAFQRILKLLAVTLPTPERAR